jgi:hypothetical protein
MKHISAGLKAIFDWSIRQSQSISIVSFSSASLALNHSQRQKRLTEADRVCGFAPCPQPAQGLAELAFKSVPLKPFTLHFNTTRVQRYR